MLCPEGCEGKYTSNQVMVLYYDDHKLPKEYICPTCGIVHPLTRKEKLLEIIYHAEWYFGGEEVDDFFIEDDDVDRVIHQIVMVVEMTRRGGVMSSAKKKN